MLLALSDVALRTAPFALPDRWFVWSRVRLYANRLELTGWSLRGRYHRSIPLGHIEAAEPVDGHLLLHCPNETTLRLKLEVPTQWASAIALHRDVRSSSV